MSLAIKYETLNDAQMRLKGTIVLYEGKPHYVTEIAAGAEDSPFRVYADALPTKGGGGGRAAEVERAIARERGEADIRKYISSKHFDIAPFAMGFVNDEKGCFYVARTPARQQKQGLSSDTCSACDVYGERKSFAVVLNSSGFPDMVSGVYPNLAQAVRTLTGGKIKSIAISREFALARDAELPELTYLYHKNKKVGFLRGTDVSLSVKYTYLKESLDEAL